MRPVSLSLPFCAFSRQISQMRIAAHVAGEIWRRGLGAPIQGAALSYGDQVSELFHCCGLEGRALNGL
jgi:hypothetical protein